MEIERGHRSEKQCQNHDSFEVDGRGYIDFTRIST